jgi:membrane-bound serine protease (ClpP class)
MHKKLPALKLLRLTLLAGLFIIGLCGSVVQADAPHALVIEAEGVINPVLAGHIQRGITQAETEGAEICVIKLDTPGGLDTSMRDIVKSITNARVPVAVYVSPSGARAASAGVFITLSGHIAAMAPNTAIGAASPVAIGPEGEVEMSETMQEKILNDSAAYIRSLAANRDRNLEWAELAVREAVSATEQEALELNVIDLISATDTSLLNDIDGWEVKLIDDTTITLNTSGIAIRVFEMSGSERFLFAISDPNIAYLLMGLAMLGLFVEISNPGLIFPGVFGAIALLLAFFSLGTLPVNIAGLLLILLAVGLFIAEVFTVSFGIFTAGGITSLVIGSLILFKGGPMFGVNPWLIAIGAIVIAAFMVFVVYKVIGAHKYRAYTGREDIIGGTGIAKSVLDPKGNILFRGELWLAESESGTINAEEEVDIIGIDGLKLKVTKKQ